MTVQPRKQYTAEFKAQILELEALGRKPRELAEEFGISKDLIYTWKRKAKESQLPQLRSGDAGAVGDQDAADELRQLRRRVADLELENDILKKPHSSSAPNPKENPRDDSRHQRENRSRHPPHLLCLGIASQLLLPERQAH